MSLVDLVLPPAREQEKTEKQGDAASQKKISTKQPTTTPASSYTDQPSPKVQSRDSIDSAVYQEFYAPRSPEQSSDSLIASKKRKAMEDPPALPERSVLRASRVLDSINITKMDSEPTSLTQSTPHDMYLSSEEEASSSADDFSDYDFDDDADVEDLESGSEESQKSPVRRKSHEDTARVVSVVFSGRPSIIDVSTSKRSASPASLNQKRPRTSVASTPESLMGESRRPSTSSTTPAPLKIHPPRSSSMMLPPTTTMSKLHKHHTHRPEFLNMDPFANHSHNELPTLSKSHTHHHQDEDVPRTPKTPTAVLKSVSRTFSLVKKRSRPLLNNFHHSNHSSSLLSNPSTTSSASIAHHQLGNGSTMSLHRLERSQTPQSLSSSLHSSEAASPSSPSGDDFVLHSEPAVAAAPSMSGWGRRRDSALPLSPPPPPPPPHTPLSPSGKMKGILAMARRRSIHIRAAAARV